MVQTGHARTCTYLIQGTTGCINSTCSRDEHLKILITLTHPMLSWIPLAGVQSKTDSNTSLRCKNNKTQLEQIHVTTKTVDSKPSTHIHTHIKSDQLMLNVIGKSNNAVEITTKRTSIAKYYCTDFKVWKLISRNPFYSWPNNVILLCVDRSWKNNLAKNLLYSLIQLLLTRLHP